MGRVVYTPDGKSHIISEINDILDIVSVYCGENIASTITEYIDDEVSEALYKADVAEQEQRAADSRLEDLEGVLHNAQDMSNELLDYLVSTDRWKKQEVIDKISNISRRINEQL